MLVRDRNKRATAADVLAHEWIKEGGVAGDNVIEPEVLKRIRGFAAMNKLKKEALKVKVVTHLVTWAGLVDHLEGKLGASCHASILFVCRNDRRVLV